MHKPKINSLNSSRMYCRPLQVTFTCSYIRGLGWRGAGGGGGNNIDAE